MKWRTSFRSTVFLVCLITGAAFALLEGGRLLTDPCAGLRLLSSRNCGGPYGMLSVGRDSFDQEIRYRSFARHGEDQELLGHGSFSAASVGRLPEGFEKHVEVPQGCRWRVGDRVVVKTLLEIHQVDEVTQKILEHEGAMMARVYPHDPQRLFVRGAMDRATGSLLMEYDPQLITLSRFLAYHRLTHTEVMADHHAKHTAEGKAEVAKQLAQVLEVLRRAGIVHGDLRPHNLLIHPETLRLKVIDFTLAADVGSHPAFLKGKREGRAGYLSPNQAADGPAAFADDAFAVNKTLADFDKAIEQAAQFKKNQ